MCTVDLNANREKSKTQTFQSLKNFPVTVIAVHILQTLKGLSHELDWALING
jgi:hypothetical protein